MESATIHLWGNKYRYVSDDPIFSLQEPVNPSSVKLPAVPETQCPCCYRELDNKMIKTMTCCNSFSSQSNVDLPSIIFLALFLSCGPFHDTLNYEITTYFEQKL